jgi:hypothetical protein
MSKTQRRHSTKRWTRLIPIFSLMSPRGVLRDCCLRIVTRTGWVRTKVTSRTYGVRLRLLPQLVLSRRAGLTRRPAFSSRWRRLAPPTRRFIGRSWCDRAESLDPDQGEPVVGEPSPWFAIERENLRVAMAHALKQMPERALRAAVAAWRSWMASGMHAEGLQWLQRALAACSEVSDVHVRGLFATAVFEVRLGSIEEAAPLGRSIADIGRHDEDPLRRAEAAHLHCLLSWLAAEWDTIDRLLDMAEHDLRGMPPVRAAHDHLYPTNAAPRCR